MNCVWTWGGSFFGYLEGENLWTYDGKHIGKLRRGVIFGPNGRYLGELRDGNRLIIQTGAEQAPIPAYVPYTSRSPAGRYDNLAAIPLPEGCEDFPSAESFHR
jgi:hypothetical protein